MFEATLINNKMFLAVARLDNSSRVTLRNTSGLNIVGSTRKACVESWCLFRTTEYSPYGEQNLHSGSLGQSRYKTAHTFDMR